MTLSAPPISVSSVTTADWLSEAGVGRVYSAEPSWVRPPDPSMSSSGETPSGEVWGEPEDEAETGEETGDVCWELGVVPLELSVFPVLSLPVPLSVSFAGCLFVSPSVSVELVSPVWMES